MKLYDEIKLRELIGIASNARADYASEAAMPKQLRNESETAAKASAWMVADAALDEYLRKAEPQVDRLPPAFGV